MLTLVIVFFYKGGHSFSMKLPLIPFQFTAIKCRSSLEFAPFYCNFIHIYRTNPSKLPLLVVLKAAAMLLESHCGAFNFCFHLL
ncbi:hypothetical protein ES319_D05G398600v1 [Gossypium barbadense]|uniref:Uncharacterized protein n=1 Tax=Gossypium barbadense TaxID=3634 RepID=A0A5J5RMZ1_GOSBA|nr:hypothetical protein ES319_D05G398600v1 [Gossypium barbadense]